MPLSLTLFVFSFRAQQQEQQQLQLQQQAAGAEGAGAAAGGDAMAAQVCNGLTLGLLWTFFVFFSVCATHRSWCVAPRVFHAAGLFSALVCLKTARFWWRVFALGGVFALGMLVLVYPLCCLCFPFFVCFNVCSRDTCAACL